MPSRILLISRNYQPELTGIGKFNGEMIDWLASHGNDCTVITSFPYYPHWKIQKPYKSRFLGYKKEFLGNVSNEKIITVYRCPQYVPKNPTGNKRILLDITFFLSSLLLICRLLFKKKYTHVICVVPSFELGLLAILYKKIRGSKFLYHIQDLQIETAKELKMVKSPLLIRFLLTIEKFILSRADIISSISEGMIDKIKTKCNKKVVLFPNWVDTNFFYPISGKEALKQEYGFRHDQKIVLYSGAIGEKQGLESIITIAKALRHIKYLKFVICGTGPYRPKLEKLTQNLDLDNVHFLSLQPLEKLNRFLNMADIHLVLQKANANNLVMPSKLTSILSIGGLAIITALEDSSLYKTVSTHFFGILVKPGNDQDLINAINEALKADADEIKDNARLYARENLSIDKVLSSYSTNLN